MSKRKEFDEDAPVDPSVSLEFTIFYKGLLSNQCQDLLEFINLGAGNEVGRSCHVIQYKGKTVMVF